MPKQKLLPNNLSVISFIDFMSSELVNKAWPKLQICVTLQCFGCQLL